MGLIKRTRARVAGKEQVLTELAGGWWMVVPGSPEIERELDGTVALWDEAWTIRVTTIASSGRADGEPIPPEKCLTPIDGAMERTANGVLLNLGLEHRETIDGQQLWTVPTQAAVPNNVAIVFFHCHEPSQDRAHDVARTLVHVA